tara:strand:- start:45 stop:1451 length:1407 start_codon:yes stop_codon:yes gene_type:complete
MFKSLKRPMFNMGGRANNGITAGFGNGGMTRPTYQQGGISTHTMPDGTVMRGATHQNRNDYKHGGVSQRQGFAGAGYVDLIDQYYPAPEKQKGFSRSDYLRIAAAGAEIMGAPTVDDSGGIGGALANASSALSGLGQDLATSADARDAQYFEQKNAYDRLRAGTAIEQKLTADANEFQMSLQDRTFENDKLLLDDNQAFELDMIGRETEAAIEVLRAELELFPDKYKKEIQIREERGNELIEEMKDPNISLEDYKQKRDVLTNIIYGEWTRLITGEKADLQKNTAFSDALATSIRNAIAASKIKEGEPGYPNIYNGMSETEIRKKLTKEVFEASGLIDNYVPPWPGAVREENSQGGRVGRAMGGSMDPDMPNALPTPGFEPGSGPVQDPNQVPIMQAEASESSPDQGMPLTYEELRKRLPAEVNDSVIRLILNSEEAMIDFAQLQTPQDIVRFNQKYNAELELPTQVA